MFPEACREDRLRAGLCSVRRQSYSGFLASHLSCTYVQISSASPQKKKIRTYHNIRQARVRFGAHVRARCRARCRCRSPVPRAPIRTQTQVFTYVRTYVLP